MQITINKLEKSEVEIIGILPWTDFSIYEDKALAAIGDRLELPGFRKGKAPANIVRENTNDMMILEEMAQHALYTLYPTIIEENKIDAIGRPEIAITKIARGENLEFKIVTAILPEITLPDYKILAHKHTSNPDFKKEIVVDEADIEKTILQLRKMRAEQNHPVHEHEDNEAHDHTKEEIPESQYPVLDDAFVKSFGDFASVEAFKDKIRSNMKIEKETEQKDKVRLAIIEELIEQSKGEIPEILIKSETDKIFYRLEADITNMGFTFADYMAQIGKTEEELRKEWRADAKKRAKLQMIVDAIARKENIKPTEEEIAVEVTKITTMYKEADPVRAEAYVENMLINEKVFAFLENQ